MGDRRGSRSRGGNTDRALADPRRRSCHRGRGEPRPATSRATAGRARRPAIRRSPRRRPQGNLRPRRRGCRLESADRRAAARRDGCRPWRSGAGGGLRSGGDSRHRRRRLSRGDAHAAPGRRDRHPARRGLAGAPRADARRRRAGDRSRARALPGYRLPPCSTSSATCHVRPSSTPTRSISRRLRASTGEPAVSRLC